MNFGKAFTFIFDDKDWLKKTGLVALCQLIPLLGQFIALGFFIEIMRRVIANDPLPLPDFDFGGFLGKGFQAFLISLVYTIPIYILYIPVWIASAASTGMDYSDVAGILTVSVSIICSGLAILYGIFISFLIPAAYARFAASGSMGPAFQFGKVFTTVTKAFVPFLIAVLGTLLVSLVTPLGLIVCFVGAFATMVYYFAVSAHLFAQAYRQAVPVPNLETNNY